MEETVSPTQLLSSAALISSANLQPTAQPFSSLNVAQPSTSSPKMRTDDTAETSPNSSDPSFSSQDSAEQPQNSTSRCESTAEAKGVSDTQQQQVGTKRSGNRRKRKI